MIDLPGNSEKTATELSEALGRFHCMSEVG